MKPLKLVTSKKLRIDIWSDIACPWCYVGKRRLEAALTTFRHAPSVEVAWRAFELDPSAPRQQDTSVSYAARLGKKYGKTEAEAQKMIDRMTITAREDGLDFRFDHIKPGNTFDAHRIIHLAGESYGYARQGAVKERLLRAYMTEGESIGDHDTLVRLGVEAGLDADRVRTLLASDAHAEEVRDDENEARELGISGVPFFVLGGVYAVSGAQSADVLLRALTQAWADHADIPVESAEGAVCGPDGCA